MSLEVVLVVPDVREQRLLHLRHEEGVLARAAVTGKEKIGADRQKRWAIGCVNPLSRP